MTAIRAFLSRHHCVAIDSSVFIYYLEENPVWSDLAGEVFSWLERPGHSGITSTITMAELLVQPYKAGDETRVNAYFGLLSRFPNLEWVPPDLHICDAAARIRAQFGFRTPDALQVATAIRARASAILTNDIQMARIPDIATGILDRLK